MRQHLELLKFLIVHRLVDRHDASHSVYGEDPLWILIYSHAVDLKSDLVSTVHFNL